MRPQPGNNGTAIAADFLPDRSFTTAPAIDMNRQRLPAKRFSAALAGLLSLGACSAVPVTSGSDGNYQIEAGPERCLSRFYDDARRRLLEIAGAYCAERGMRMELIDSNGQDGTIAQACASAQVQFGCTDPLPASNEPPAAEAPAAEGPEE